MTTTLLTSYGHEVSVADRHAGGVTLTISESPQMDTYDVHLRSDQALELANALPGDVTATEREDTERGFHRYPSVVTTLGTVLRPQESSAASGPHLWIFHESTGPVAQGNGPLTLELDAAACAALKSAILTWHGDIPNRWQTLES